MCGIFGFSGKGKLDEILINGLKRLEYRGYDSWGIAVAGTHGLKLHKEVGKIGDSIALDANAADASRGIAHTRWATHGGVTHTNAHPHTSSDGNFCLAQNGIVENYQELKQELLAEGYDFQSETDTEVIVRLIESDLTGASASDMLTAVTQSFAKLAGRNTIIVLTKAGDIVAIRNGSPLVVGRQQENYFIGSDYLSFANHTQEILELDDMQGVYISANSDGDELQKFEVDAEGKYKFINTSFETVDEDPEEVDKGEFADYMIKEISEQPDTIRRAITYSEADLQPLVDDIEHTRGKVYTLGCGTAYYAAAQIAYYLRKYAHIDALALRGYELDSYAQQFASEDLMIAISQSGETADTIEAAELMQAAGGKLASLVNMLGSKLTRMSDYPYYSRTGPEICVASTKAFTAQLSFGYLLAMAVAGRFEVAKSEIERTADAMQKMLEAEDLQHALQKIVDLSANKDHFFVLGKGQNYQIALEGSLKVKEITYKHFEGFTAGELKHGVIALIEEGAPVFAIISDDEYKADVLSAANEVKSRGAEVIGVSFQDYEVFDHYLPVPEVPHTSSLLNVLPFQLLSYHLGKKLGNDVDRPRNLAKSVTVK